MSSKQREALEEVESILSTWLDHLPPIIQEQAQKAIDKAEAILDEPLRNCDVGTAEEQGMRFKKFCNDHQAPWHGCTNCPVLMSEKCAIAWSQMPYESEVTK